MADPQLDKFFKEAAAARAAKAAKPVAAAPKPPALSASPAAPVKVAKEAEERSAPSAEPVTPSAEDVKKAEKMRADLLEELPLEDFYQKAARFPVSGMAISALGERVPDKQRFFQVAGAQGIDVEDMAQKAREGVPFAEYRRTRDGVIGFKPATERFTELDRVASDYQAAERGEAPQRTIGIQKAQETTTSLPVFGEGYEVGGTTPDEIIETTKPGEHQYSIAAQFIDSFEKANPEVVSLTDMYGQNAGPGNTQKWIEKYVKMQVRNRGLTAASEDIDEQMGKLRRDAVYYILSKKTIGQWTPGVFVKDVQITDAERAKPLGTGEGFGAGVRDTFAAMAPNVEIVGFNNKGQAVVRQESPAGTALRLLDVLGVSPVGKVKGVPVVIPGQSAISGLITKDKDEGYLEAALRGVQTGATFIDAALDETKGRSTPVRAAAGLAALVPTVLYPDVTGAAEGAYTAAKAYRRVLQDRKIAKAAAPLLDELVAALKAGDYEKATKVESAIRSHPELSKGNHGVMQAQMSMDAQVAEKLKAMNPELASLTPTLGDELITVGVNQSPELAEAIYGEAVKGYPFLHFSKKAPELAARSEKEGIGPTLEAYVNSGDFGRHFQRIERAKAAFLKAAPKNSAEAIDQAVSGLAANLRAKSADVLRLGGAPAADAPRYDRLAKLLEDNKAAIIADPKAAFGKDGVLRQAIKADPVVGADDAREFRAAFYPQAARLSGRIEALKTVDFNTLYQNDLKVFDRAREAVEANIKSRMMAAELLKRELGTRAKINVVPTEILDDLMEPGTERLSAFATAKFIQTMQQLPKAADRKAWLAAFQTMDKMLRGAAELRGVPVDTYWRSIDIRVVDGKPVFVKGEDVVSAPKGPGPLDGFVDVADVQTAVARLRGALAGTDPSYRLKALTRADGSQAGGEVAVGDVVVRAIRSPQPGAPYRVEVFVGAQQKAAFTSTGKLEDAINEGIDEAQNAMTGRVAAGEPAMREVVVPKPPKTAAQAAAQTSPADAAEEAAAVDSVAATPPAAPLHPKTETVVGGLDPALKADPDVVSRILAAVDKLKAGSKLPPPPKGANKVLMGAVREELLKSGVLVKLDDGSVVKAGTLPEDVKVAPTAAPTRFQDLKPGETVTLYRGEGPDNTQNGNWWTSDPAKAARYGTVRSVTLPTEVVGKNFVQGHNSADEFVFFGKDRSIVDAAPVTQRAAAAPTVAPVAEAAPAVSPVAPAPVATAAEAEAPVFQRVAEEVAPPPEETFEELMARGAQATEDLRAAEIRAEEEFAAAQAERERALAERIAEDRRAARAREAAPPAAEEVVAEPVIQRAPAAAEEPLPAVRKAEGFRDKNSVNAGVYEVDIGGKTRRFFRDSKEGFYPGSFVEDVPTSADVPVMPFLGDTIEDAVKALQRMHGAEEAPAAARAAEEAQLRMDESLAEAQRANARVRELEARAAEARARRVAETEREAEKAGRTAAETRDFARAESPRLADLEDRFPEARPGNLKEVLREVRGWTTNESYKRVIDRLLEQGGRMDTATFSVPQSGDTGEGFAGFARLSGLTTTNYADPAKLLEVRVRGTSLGGVDLPLDETIIHEALHATTVDQFRVGRLPAARGTATAAAADALAELQVRVAAEVRARLGAATELGGISRGQLDVMVGTPTELIAYGMTRPDFQDLLKTIKVEQNKSLWTKFVESVAKLLGIAPGDESALAALIERTGRIMDLTPEEIEAARLGRITEAAPAAKAEEAVSAAPTQPSGITPVAEAPVVREEIVTPPAPPVKAEPTVDELQATVARLEPLRDAKIKRTEVSKNGFTAEVAGQQVRVEKRGDNWVNAATGRNLGDNVTEATESLRTEFVLKPYTQAQDALRKLGQVQSTAATVSSLEDALSGVKKIKTQKDALRFFDVAEQLALDANEKAQIYESLAQKLEIMAGQAKSERAAGELETLSIRARDEVTAIRPAAETAPSAVAAAQDALTEAQRHAQAVTNMRSLTHRAQVERPDGTFLMFGTAQNGVFTPAFAFRAFEGVKPSEILEVVYDQMRVSPDTMVAARREAEALLEGQTPVVREFPANKYANDADLKFGSRGSYASIDVRREARDVAADRAKKARDAELIIARTLGDDIAAEWETVPQRFAVNAESRLRRAADGLDSGKITQAEYNRLVAAVTDDLAAQKAIQAAKRGAPRQRGAAWVRSRLLAAQNAGVLDEAGVNLADWFIQQNPRVADDLGVSIRQAVEGSITAGDYEPVGRIVRLFKEKGDDLTAVHEILHHTERMLPADVQAAVRKEWAKQLTKAMENATPEQRPILEKMLAGTDRQAIRDAFVAQTVPYEFYQYANPSEFWAVNASRIVSGRYAAFNAGLVAKAKQWLTEFVQKAKGVFGLSSDAALIRGLDEVLKGDGTFVSRMLSDSGTFKSIEAPTELRQVRPAQAGGPEVVTGAFKPGGGSGLAGTQSIIELAAKTADPTTLLHEGAHFIRKSILDTEDMDNVTAWLNSMGVKVNHEFGEFVGSADDIELAEEMFATAFEKYVVTGKAPTPALERAFELVKNAFAGAYRWMKSDAAKELYGEDALSPQVTAVFNRYFTAVPQKPIESTFDIIVRETRGAKTSDAEGALDVLAREATRKGMPKTAREDLVKKIAALKLSDDVPNETVLLEFPAPVLGKTEWTKGDIIGLQAEVVRRRTQMAVNPMRQALFGQPEETKVTENIYAALAEREEGGLAAGARGIARGMAKLVLGGDIVDERGTRALPEVLRRDLDTPARIIETTIGDSVSVLTQSTRDNDPSFMFRFLAGENLRFKSGRRVLSSGHEHITGFFDLYRNQYASMTREEQALLQEWAQLLNTTPNPENLRNPQTISEALASGAFPQNLMNVRNFADLEAQRKAKANAMVAALEKFIDLGGSGEGNIGGQLRKAIKDAAGEGSQIAFNEYRFAEVLLFLSGSTSRRGVRFLPVDKTFTKDQLVEQARVLLTDAQRIYGGEDDPLFSRRLSILVAAYGSSRRAKAELAALGAVLTAEEANAFKNWTLAYNTSPEMSAQLELVKNKFGLNTKFINETILGDNVYVPAQARARMADALAKAQFNNAKLTPTGDLYQKVWTYMKKRMTRGAFALRQRYFFVNTIDHFNQMYLLVGFAPAAASSARLLLQGLPVNVIGQGYETVIRLINRAGMGDRAAMEKFRDLLSRGGDELAARIGSALSVSKYRIDVNDILEGRDKLLLVGGNVYTARQLRDTFVAEGIFSSFDTRRLADGVRMDGNIFARELAQISGSPKSSGTFVDAASRLMDGVQDVTVDVVDDLSDAWAERERVGAVITLMETGVDARAACRVTVDALYDYSQSMTKRDRSFLVGTVLPFWAFQKNANQQFINVMFSPYGAYRMMALQRLREGSVTLASELYYGYIGGELGLDVDNMPQDMQDLYYAIMTRAHEIYGDDLPDNVRIGLRIALTGRVGEVVDGKYYELDTRLIEMMRSGGLAPGGKFGGAGMADYMLAAPNKSGLPSYVRDRFGMVAPQRRNALVRHYTALMGGANEDYFYFMLPESSVETAYKHTATLLGGAFLTAGALSPEWVGIPGVDILAGGADAIGLGDIGRALQPVVDLERSPVMGLALGMYSERGYPQRLHPKVAAALQRMTNIPILRVPAKMDPFMGGTLPDTDEAFRARLEAANAVQDGIVGGTDEAGNPTDLVQILGEDYVRMVQELNSKDLPADVMAVAKEERFYLPPGFMSLSFENSPLGEFNREALRWDQTSKEGADPAGQAAYFTRVLLGTDVVQVAPSRTAQQEEPVRYTKTREPI